MSISNCTGLAWKYKQYWNRKLLSLLGSVPLKVLGMRALVPRELVLEPDRVKSISESTKYISQLFISIIALIRFWPWASRRSRSISCIISSRISRSILLVSIIVCRDDTWARNRQNYSARINYTWWRLQRWAVSLVNLSWALWSIWWISQMVTEMQDSIEKCPKWWDWSWSWRITARESHFELWNKEVVLQTELLRNNSRLGSLIILSGAVHTGGKSLWDGLGDMQTCGTTLASAYVLCYLSTAWSQLQIIGRSPRWEWMLIGCVTVEHWRSSSIRIYLH